MSMITSPEEELNIRRVSGQVYGICKKRGIAVKGMAAIKVLANFKHIFSVKKVTLTPGTRGLSFSPRWLMKTALRLGVHLVSCEHAIFRLLATQLFFSIPTIRRARGCGDI